MMNKSEKIKYLTDKSTQIEVLEHLEICNNYFVPPLNSTVDLEMYSKKIHQNALKFEAWFSQKLIGLIAVYKNDIEMSLYITNVSVEKNFEGNGIANSLLEKVVQYGKTNKFIKINLEVNKNNKIAIQLYKKHNFVKESENYNNFYYELKI